MWDSYLLENIDLATLSTCAFLYGGLHMSDENEIGLRLTME